MKKTPLAARMKKKTPLAAGRKKAPLAPRWVFTSVKTFGADGNGTTDDTAAIDQAIAAGTVIYFPPGRYRYKNPNRMRLPPNKSYRLYGDGPNVSIIEFYGSPSGSPTGGIFMPDTGRNTLMVDGLTLKAMTPGCGDAIHAKFSDASPGPEGPKIRCATIKNVQIRATDRLGNPAGYWNNGIYLSQAQNSIIDDVQMDGKFQWGNGIVWTSGLNYATTQLFITNLSMLYFGTAIQTSGWVEGFYMSGFELTGVGIYAGGFAVNLDTQTGATGVNHLPAFHLLNGHINFLSGGVRLHNLSAVKLANINFAHYGFNILQNGGSGTHLQVDDVFGVSLANCDFVGTVGLPQENGVFAASATTDLQVTGCKFYGIQPVVGTAIVILQGVLRTRLLDNAFDTTDRRYDNHAGANTYIRDIP